ncbi:MAG: hypothetical protein HDQ95_07080 [Roseburia sp.]|nr:hypothetical protein [Roseburia sp.]
MIHTNIYRKAIFRRPIRTLTLLLLLAAITYAFVAHAAEGLLVTSEIAKLEKYYQPIGTLTAVDGDVSEGAALLAGCSYMELDDVRKMCPGTLEGMQNADIDAILASGLEYYASDVIFVGELQEKKYVERPKGPGGYYELAFEVCEVEAGYAEYVQKGRKVHIRSLPDLPEVMQQEYYPLVQDEAFVEEYNMLEIGRQYLLRAHYREGAGINGAFAAQNGIPGSNFVLDKLLPTGESVYFYEMIEGESVDYDVPELEELSSYLQFLRHNQSAMLFTGTKDMSRMPICQESSRRYYLTEGRWIDREDDLNENRVCVIHNYFAKRRGLEIGDKIRVRLEDIDEYVYGYAMPEEWEKWAACEGTEEEFEIVGIYEDLETNDYFMSAYSTFVYIPSSCIPQDYSTEDIMKTAAGSYSFVLRKPSDQQRFMEEYKDSLDELGIQAQFVENNAENFAISAQQLQSSTMFSTVLFGAVLFFIILFLCGLYLVQRSREYAVARALGVSGRKAAGGMVLAFGWIGMPGVLAGETLGWYRTIRSAEQILSPLAKEAEESGHTLQSADLPLGWLAGMIALTLLTAFAVLLSGSFIITGKPILMLLQGGANVRGEKGRKKNKAIESREEESIPLPLDRERFRMSEANAADCNVTTVKGNRRKAELTYIARHQIRSAGKSMLILLLGVGAVLTFGWMYRTIQNNLLETERIYETTVIEGEIIKANSGTTYNGTGGGVIAPKMVEAVAESGLVSDVYTEETGVLLQVYKQNYQKTDQIETPKSILRDVPILGIYDWEGFLEETGADLSVQFQEGKSDNSFTKDRESGDMSKYEAILSEDQLAFLGARIGDTVHLVADASVSLNMISCVIVGSYQGTPAGIPSDAVIVHAVTMHDLVGKNYYDLVARFTFNSEKNRELMEREEELEQLVKEWRGNFVAMRLMIWDEELYAAVEPMERTLSLFGILYPVAMAVFLVLGFGFQFLVLLLRRREAAVMRVLGNSVGTVRKLLMTEQIWLCALGLLVGAILLLILDWQPALSVWQAAGLYLLGSVAGTVAGSIAVTGKRPLELLQVHE